jgi:putative nucleotidyltransferase with HDIG domain
MPALTVSQRVARSLTLLRAFIVVSGLLLAAAAFLLGMLLGHAVRDQAIEDAKVSVTDYSSGILSQHLVHPDGIAVGNEATEVMERSLAVRPDVLSLKVWRPDGVLAWTNVATRRIGKQFPLEGSHVHEVLESGEAEAEVERLGEGENSAEANLGVERALEVYAPVKGQRGQVIGAFEVYTDFSRVEASIAKRKHQIWLTSAAVFVALWALLVLLVRGASAMLRRQTEALRARSKALMESYRRLEESSLEAIESLNATVEAKDPYTAGHSARVQRIALALGEQLGLTPDRIEALRFGGLFHDIGKLGVPDAVLTKRARLTADEFELIKRHSEDGARIVAKFGPLRESVPLIRHHHERWDGRGYPDGLSGAEIPLEAAVLGLADAWDAMTTERPYHHALSIDSACAEIRSGRGSQFAPAVVDAFFEVLRRRPSELQFESRPASAADEERDVLAEAG